MSNQSASNCWGPQEMLRVACSGLIKPWTNGPLGTLCPGDFLKWRLLFHMKALSGGKSSPLLHQYTSSPWSSHPLKLINMWIPRWLLQWLLVIDSKILRVAIWSLRVRTLIPYGFLFTKIEKSSSMNRSDTLVGKSGKSPWDEWPMLQKGKFCRVLWDKGQSFDYNFSSSQVWMLPLDHKEG